MLFERQNFVLVGGGSCLCSSSGSGLCRGARSRVRNPILLRLGRLVICTEPEVLSGFAMLWRHQRLWQGAGRVRAVPLEKDRGGFEGAGGAWVHDDCRGSSKVWGRKRGREIELQRKGGDGKKGKKETETRERSARACSKRQNAGWGSKRA